MDLKRNFLSLGKKARSGIKLTRPVNLIVIHWIGPYSHPTVYATRTWWENGTDGTGVPLSAHFVVKREDVLQCLPLDEVGWHTKDERNFRSIGIEVIPMNTEGSFSQVSIRTII